MKYWITVRFNSFSQPDCFLFVCSSSRSLFKGFLILNPDRTVINAFIMTIQLKELITDVLPAFTPAIEGFRFIPLTDFFTKAGRKNLTGCSHDMNMRVMTIDIVDNNISNDALLGKVLKNKSSSEFNALFWC
ncbi:hypothetical protein KP3161_16805 [Klebsiella pneumoniae]|nr:hypothetical protein KP3161_16805 [Klebsiella pneumoniae]